MNRMEMYASLNKGVPNYIPITLDIETLIKECSDDENLLRYNIRLIGNIYQKRIANIVGMTKAERAFFKKFRLWTNYGTAETNLFVSPTTLLEELKIILGVKRKTNNDDELKELLKGRLNYLFKIKTPDELRVEFPLIYQDYLLSISSEQQIRKLTPIKPREVIREQWRFYDMYGLSSNFNQFMNRQRIMYRNLVLQSKRIEIDMNTHPIDLNRFNGLNKAKFELYLAYKYLEYALNTNNIQEKQECIYYICTYIRETKYTPVTINDENGTLITFAKLTRGYRKLFKKNIELKPIDADRSRFMGFHINHVKNHVKKHFMSAINWHIVPKGHDLSRTNREVISSLNRRFRHMTPEEKVESIKAAYAVYERKLNFFESTDYVEKIYGIGEFNGYMAYFYPNGEVLMEKFFDDYSESTPAKSEAIYNLKIGDFETLSKLSKPKLMKDNRCRRIIHSGKWEDRARMVIDKEATEESKVEVQKVLTKIKTYNSK